MGLEFTIRDVGDVTIVDLRGRATIGSGNDALNDQLRNLVNSGARKLLLNLEQVTHLDSSSIGTIVRIFVSLRRQGGSLKLLNPRGKVQMVLQVTHLMAAIPTFEDEAQVLTSFH